MSHLFENESVFNFRYIPPSIEYVFQFNYGSAYDIRVKNVSKVNFFPRLRLDLAPGDFSRRRTKKRSRKTSNECFYGLGSSGQT